MQTQPPSKHNSGIQHTTLAVSESAVHFSHGIMPDCPAEPHAITHRHGIPVDLRDMPAFEAKAVSSMGPVKSESPAEQPAASPVPEAKTGLLRMLIHDLTNPLSIALNFARLMNSTPLSSQESDEAISIITDHLERMQALLEDLSLLEELSEHITTTFETLDIDVLAATVIAELEEQASRQHITLTLTDLPESACVVDGNKRLLHQAIYNLVENAIKYTLPDGWVRVTLRHRGPWLEVIVADNGIGIPPAHQYRLFSPFFRAKDSRMSDVPGTGLGLSLVQMVTRQHQGTITLHSIPDQGSIFVLRVPRQGEPK